MKGLVVPLQGSKLNAASIAPEDIALAPFLIFPIGDRDLLCYIKRSRYEFIYNCHD